MRKYRVTCPHCEATLLVTEDLLGQAGNCPGCQAEFLLPTEESFLNEIRETPALPKAQFARNLVEAPVLTSPSVPRPAPELPPLEPPQSPRQHKLVKIEGRPALRMLAGMLRGMAGLQAVAGIAILVILLFNAVRTPMPADMVLITVGVAVLVGSCSIPTLAFSELIIVFISQEEMSRHMLNELRSRE